MAEADHLTDKTEGCCGFAAASGFNPYPASGGSVLFLSPESHDVTVEEIESVFSGH
jgi:hypothetical protein